MRITEKIKIIFNLKKYTFEELTTLKKYVDEEYNKRKKIIKKLQ